MRKAIYQTLSNETRPAASAQGQAREKRCEIFKPHNGLRETHVAVMAGLQGDCAVADGLGHLPWLRAHVPTTHHVDHLQTTAEQHTHRLGANTLHCVIPGLY